MRKIFKYELSLAMDTPIAVPPNADVNLVAIQEGALRIWFQLSIEEPVVNPRVFRVYATGQEIASNDTWVGSAITQSGTYVWHVYEVQQ